MTRSKAVTTVAGGTKALSALDAELANEVANLKQQIGMPGGKAIKINPTGSFTSPEGFDLGTEIQIVVLDFITAHRFYPGAYVEGNPEPPVCYALGRNIVDLKPEADSPQVQHTDCATCPLNVFGTGSNGKSKACKNTRELAVLLIDPNDSEALASPKSTIYTMSIAPNSLKFFDGFVSTVMRSLGPPIKAIVTVLGEPKGTYAATSFVDPVPNPYYAQHAARRVECQDLLFRKPDFAAYAARQSTRPVARRVAAKPVRVAAGARR